jgi:hypothetical protein
MLDDWHALDHKCPHENVARHDYYYLSDHYQLALCWPGRFRLKIQLEDAKHSGQQTSALV